MQNTSICNPILQKLSVVLLFNDYFGLHSFFNCLTSKKRVPELREMILGLVDLLYIQADESNAGFREKHDFLPRPFDPRLCMHHSSQTKE